MNFVLPSRKKIKSLSRKHAAKKREDIIKSLEKVKKIAITTDAWTSTKQRLGFLGITVHYYKKFILKSISLGVKKLSGSHTAENLAEALTDFLNEFRILEKIISITGDNASNMRAAAKLLNEANQFKIKFHGCFAHILNLTITAVIKSLKLDLDNEDEYSTFDFNKILCKCRKLVGLFSHSTHLNEQLLKEQENTENNTKLRLVQDVVTR